ncbi:MAG TPA: hypothetical protein VFM70_07515 [Salinimicrobium sp.]|nr:hypothetical protein [Salinimicrobium sp.]
MEQDIRELFKKEKTSHLPSMSEGHMKRFEKKLDKEFPQKRIQNYLWWKIAAILIVAIFTATFFLIQKSSEEIEVVHTPVEEQEKEKSVPQFSLSDISPEYKKVENYYLAGINMEISKLKITDENKDLIDSFLQQLAILDAEYAKLNSELAAGINEQTIQALVDNLKLRMELLMNLKTKLKELKNYPDENTRKNNV